VLINLILTADTLSSLGKKMCYLYVQYLNGIIDLSEFEYFFILVFMFK